MKHSELKVGMKVKRNDMFDPFYYTSTEGNISTVKSIHEYGKTFATLEDEYIVWSAEYFDKVEDAVGNTQKEKETMNKISLDKKYKTRDGKPVRVLCVDMKDTNYPVVALVEEELGESPYTFTENGSVCYQEVDAFDLIEVSPYEDFKKDDKVMVSSDGETWYRRYFSHVDSNGYPHVFNNGSTSWVSYETTEWGFCRKPTQEELDN